MKKRYQDIIELIKTRPFMKIEDFCRELDVSPATIRRDLAYLEDSGLILRINGGAMYNKQTEEIRAELQAPSDPLEQQKIRIAEAAVLMVQEGDTIFMDAGSTNQQIAKLLASQPSITVITNSLEIANKLHNRIKKVIICGGTLGEADRDSIVGPVAEKMISMFRANLCFIGTSGIDIRQGVTDTYLALARIKENMIEHSNKVFLVADHTKFGVIKTAFVCPIDKIQHIITDRDAPPEDMQYLRSRGIAVTLV